MRKLSFLRGGAHSCNIAGALFLALLCADGFAVESGTAVADDEDTATYFWKSDVASGDWNNPANWTSSAGGENDRYPNGAKCTVNFENAPAEVTVSLNGIFSAKQLTMGKNGISVKLQGANTNDSKLVTTDRFSGTQNSTFTLDAAYLQANGLGFEQGMTFTLDHAAFFKTSIETAIKNTGARLNIRNESVFFQEDWCVRMSKADAKVVIDNGTFMFSPGRGNQDMDLAFENSSPDDVNTVEFYGDHPRLLTGFYGVRAGSDMTGDKLGKGAVPLLVFHVPAGGYTQTPVVHTGALNQRFAGLRRQKVGIVVADDSPCFAARAKTACKLVEWQRKIDAEYIEFREPAKTGFSMFYTYGWEGGASTDATLPLSDGDLPTAIWMSSRPVGMIISIR